MFDVPIFSILSIPVNCSFLVLRAWCFVGENPGGRERTPAPTHNRSPLIGGVTRFVGR